MLSAFIFVYALSTVTEKTAKGYADAGFPIYLF